METSKKKALFINGSPRKNKNTAQLLLKAMEGAQAAGAQTEFINLYDVKYRGCMSCFACKLKGKNTGLCSYKDDLHEVLAKAVEADVLVVGSPVYCSYPSAMLRGFMERLVFPAVNYSDYQHPVVHKQLRSATIYTMNCPSEEVYKQIGYDVLLGENARQLGMFGPTETLCSLDTYQFNDYSRYETAQLNEPRKAARKATEFPRDLQKAYELGRRLVLADEAL
jgi:multimeric flavodoxin WrbA